MTQTKAKSLTGIQDSVRVASTISFCLRTSYRGPWLPGPTTGHLARGGIVWNIFAHKLAIYSDPAFATDSHAVQTEPNTWLNGGQEPFVVQIGFGHTLKSDQVVHRTLEDKVTIGLTNVDLSGDSATPGRQGSVTDLQILDMNKVPLLPFQPLSQRIAKSFDFVHVPVLVSTADLNQDQNQQYQNSLQHSL